MAFRNAASARRIIDFYSERGVDCTVVDEHASLLVTLCACGETHRFRCAAAGERAPLQAELGRLLRCGAPGRREGDDL